MAGLALEKAPGVDLGTVEAEVRQSALDSRDASTLLCQKLYR
jgi:hypothetical protein